MWILNNQGTFSTFKKGGAKPYPPLGKVGAKPYPPLGKVGAKPKIFKNNLFNIFSQKVQGAKLPLAPPLRKVEDKGVRGTKFPEEGVRGAKLPEYCAYI